MTTRLSNLDPASLARISSLLNRRSAVQFASTSRRTRNVTQPVVRAHRRQHLTERAGRRWVNSTVGAPQKIAEELLVLSMLKDERAFRIRAAQMRWKETKTHEYGQVYTYTKRFGTYSVKLSNFDWRLTAQISARHGAGYVYMISVSILRNEPAAAFISRLGNGNANLDQKVRRLQDRLSATLSSAMEVYQM